MAFNINDFRAQLQYGGARPSLFEVDIFNPLNSTADAEIKFMCRAAAIPASTMSVINQSYFGRQVKMAGVRTFDPWTVTILNDEDMNIRNALEQWNTEINTLEGNVRTSGIGDALYKSTGLVRQFGKDGRVLREYEFNGLWCSDIAQMDLNWDTDAVQEYTVTFQYDYWQLTTNGDTPQTVLN